MRTHGPNPLFIRIGLVVAIAAGLAVTGLNLSRLKQKITSLQSNLAAQTTARQKAETDLADTQTKLAKTTATLQATKTELETTTAEKQKALATAAAQLQRAEKATHELVTNSQERDTAQAELGRYRAAGMEPEQIIVAAKRINQLAAALAAAQQTNNSLVAQLKRQPVPDGGPILLPSDLRAKVVACDSKWRFIILDAGEKQGVRENAEVLISRQGKLVARAKVSRLQSDHCVANLMSGWDLAEVVEGDVVIPAFPHS